MMKTAAYPAKSDSGNVYDTPNGYRRLYRVTPDQPAGPTATVYDGTPRQIAVRHGWTRPDGEPIKHDVLELDALAFDYTIAVPAGDIDVLNSMMLVVGGRNEPPAVFSENATDVNGDPWGAEQIDLTIRQAQLLGDLEDMMQSLALELANQGEPGLAEALQRMRWFQRVHPDTPGEVLKIDSDQPTDRGELLFIPGQLVRTNVATADTDVQTDYTHLDALTELGLTMI